MNDKPIYFSSAFGVDKKVLDKLGVFDPIINYDANLFIDPTLIQKSSNPIIRSSYEKILLFFRDIVELLDSVDNGNRDKDIAWQECIRIFSTLKEVSGTCIGTAKNTTHGRGLDSQNKINILDRAKQIYDKGIRNPNLFIKLPLLVEKIGADKISDMITTIILEEIAGYTEEIVNKIGLQDTKDISINRKTFKLPTYNGDTIYLLPKDILSKLKIASDKDEIWQVCAQNDKLRQEMNQIIGEEWRKVKITDIKIGTSRLSKESLEKLLDGLQTRSIYNVDQDESYRWLKDAESNFINCIINDEDKTLKAIVLDLIMQFKRIIENNGSWKLFWNDSNNVHEKYAQQLLSHSVRMVIDRHNLHKQVNKIDFSAEVNNGNGPIDIKFSDGKDKVLVEIKMSYHKQLDKGYGIQLEEYKKAEYSSGHSIYGIYLVIDLGINVGKQLEKLEAKHNKTKLSDLIIIDASKRESASKIKYD